MIRENCEFMGFFVDFQVDPLKTILPQEMPRLPLQMGMIFNNDNNNNIQ